MKRGEDAFPDWAPAMDDDYLLLAEEQRPGRQKALLIGKIALAVLGVALLVALLVLRTWPPLNVVMSGSMEPAIGTGDVVVMGRLDRPAEVGDIVPVHPPQRIQQNLNYPDTIIHRIVQIDPDGTVYTKGDARKQRDPFTVPRDAIEAHVVATIPSVGQIVAFFTSPLGLIWLGLGLLLFILLPYLELRRDQVELEQAELDSLATMRLELREVADRVEGGRPPGPGPVPESELQEMRETMDELVAAVGEYGEHLRSHTAVLQGMSSASQDLAAAVAELRGALPTLGAAVPSGPAQPAAPPVTPAAPPVTPAAQPAPPPAPTPPAWTDAQRARYKAELFIRWQQQRAAEIAASMGFRDPQEAARRAPLDEAADDGSIERKLWELAFEQPDLLGF